jgi:ABC-type sulfate transport system substrate-binding protein
MSKDNHYEMAQTRYSEVFDFCIYFRCICIKFSISDTGFLNVSCDLTRELYKVVDATFAEIWRKKSGNLVTIRTTNGGSRAQMQSVVDGAPADVVTLACAGDIDFISRTTGKVDKD